MEEIHICTNCKHCFKHNGLDCCDSLSVDLITGTFHPMACIEVRNAHALRCSYYEPKATLLKRVRKLFKR